jgi:hypothetical protein
MTKMMTIFDRLANSVRKHAEYRRTVEALKGVSPMIREDVEVYPGLERAIARQAVYGN